MKIQTQHLLIGAAVIGVGYYLYSQHQKNSGDAGFANMTVLGTNMSSGGLSGSIAKQKQTPRLLADGTQNPYWSAIGSHGDAGDAGYYYAQGFNTAYGKYYHAPAMNSNNNRVIGR